MFACHAFLWFIIFCISRWHCIINAFFSLSFHLIRINCRNDLIKVNLFQFHEFSWCFFSDFLQSFCSFALACCIRTHYNMQKITIFHISWCCWFSVFFAFEICRNNQKNLINYSLALPVSLENSVFEWMLCLLHVFLLAAFIFFCYFAKPLCHIIQIEWKTWIKLIWASDWRNLNENKY